MPDITMCDNHKCKARKSCYRYTATPCEWRQSYFAEHPEGNKHGSCEYFTPNDTGEHNVKQIKETY